MCILSSVQTLAKCKPQRIAGDRQHLSRGRCTDAFVKTRSADASWRNPVMFVVEVGSVLTTVLWVQALVGHGEAPAGFIGAVAVWLWFTVLFANFAEAMAEGRGKAQADALRRKARHDTPKKLAEPQRTARLDTVVVDGAAQGRYVFSSKRATSFRRTAK